MTTIREIIEGGGPQTFDDEQIIMWKVVMDRLSTTQGKEEIIQEHSKKEGRRRRQRGLKRSLLALTIERHAPSRVILAVLKAYPQAASKQQRKGMLPIHLACQHRSSLDVVLALLLAYPNGIKRPTQCGLIGENTLKEDGWLPIHFAVQAASYDVPAPEISISIVNALLDIYPEGASQPTIPKHRNFLPIHIACQVKAHVEVIHALLRVYPQGARVRTFQNGYIWHTSELPLHIAISRQSSIETINILLDEYPEGACELGFSNTTTVMHFALNQVGVDFNLLMRILQACPRVATIEDSSGSLPLHIACDNTKNTRTPSSIIFALLDAYPNGVRHSNKNGDLPIHLACHANNKRLDDPTHTTISDQIVHKLLQVYPNGAQHPNMNGQLPIHVAVCDGSTSSQSPTLSIIKQLVDCFPRGLQALAKIEEFDAITTNAIASYTPLHGYVLCHQSNISKNIIEYLVDKAYPDDHEICKSPRSKTKEQQEEILWPNLSSSYKPESYNEHDLAYRIQKTISRKLAHQNTNWLHRAAAGGAPLDIIKLLMKMYPSQIDQREKSQNNEHRHLIHFAALADIPQLDVIQFLNQVWIPTDVMKLSKLSDNWGPFPLHFVLQNPATTNQKALSSKIEVAQFLLQDCPSATSVVDHVTGLLPFQSACLNLTTSLFSSIKTGVINSDQNDNDIIELKKTELLFELLKLHPAVLYST